MTNRLNMEAWERSALSFIKSKGLEGEFQDYCGGWPTPIDPVQLRNEHRASWIKEYQQLAKKDLAR